MARPSDFLDIFPSSSLAPGPHKLESELIAQNIMVILKRKGDDEIKPLSWEEYKEHRLKDGNFTEGEKEYFDKVINYFKSEDTVRLFSPKWEAVPHRIYLKPRTDKEPKRKIRWR